ncbi:hypothetical protein [Nisaea sp.]|uniref:hypothetical protein n=1 Tax=Nisaea sp. TaxID=2024842 RepID=UPI003B52A70B
MPLAAALLKLTLFIMWARPTYKMTVDMYEKRERRLGILPKGTISPGEANGRTGTGGAIAGPPRPRLGDTVSTRQTRKG